MKIIFDNQHPIDTAKSNSIIADRKTESVSRTEESVIISNSEQDNKTYEGRKISKNDLQTMMSTKDVFATQDYMTVMSNSMSTDDFNKMVESGERPMALDAEESVTILDTIKLYVAKSGTKVEGFTDTLDKETVEAITGSKAVDSDLEVPEYDITIDKNTLEETKEAYEMLSDISEMTEGMKKFFVGTERSFTIDNLYLAKHSAAVQTMNQGSAYFGVDATGYLAKKADNAQDSEISVQVSKLFEELNIEASEDNINRGLWLVDNSLCVTNENIEKLEKAESIKFPISDFEFARAVAIALSEGKSPKEADVTKREDFYNEAVKLTRTLEETRLKMTAEANLLLLESDYHIDTDKLEEYVEALKQVENSTAYKEMKEITKVEETRRSIEVLPVALIGRFEAKIEEATLTDIRAEGEIIKERFSKAEIAYEQVGTQVRRDLGDSIKKAFRNIDDILDEIELPKTEENRRAIRILGYNSMPVNKESIGRIREADARLQSVIARLTPSDTLKLIRKGMSPIDMSIKELNDYLDGKQDFETEEIEKYSKYLYKLENNHEINESERKEFIEVYRFFHQLEKNDLAAVGSVINAGWELTIGNLKTAIKTAKYKGLDIKADASYGMLISDIRSELEPEKVARTEFSDATTLDSVYEKLAEAPLNGELENSWLHEQYAEMKEALSMPAEVVENLVMNNVPVTVQTLEGAFGLMKQKGKTFAKVPENLPEAFENRESAAKAYGEFITEAKEEVFEETLMQDTFVDVKAMKLQYLQLSTALSFSADENYEIPMEIGGKPTSVNLRVVHNLEEEPNVRITFETEELGSVEARLTSEGGTAEGYIACNLRETVTKMQKVADKLSNRVKAIYSKTGMKDSIHKLPMKDNTEEVPSQEMYTIAKTFLESLKGI